MLFANRPPRVNRTKPRDDLQGSTQSCGRRSSHMYKLGRVVVAGWLLAAAGSAMAGQSATSQSNIGQGAGALTAAYNASGQKLFATLGTASGNVVFSPYSIGTAMAMTLAGGRGETAAEMTGVLMHRLGMAEIDAANSEAMAILAAYDHSRDPWTCPAG